MGDEQRTIMMLALTVEPIGGGDWRWRWYDHDSNLTLADGVEGDVVAAWRAATTHHVKSADEVLRTIRARAEAAEQRAETAERELAQVRAVVESRLAEVSQHDYTMRTLWGSHNKDREVEIRTLQKVLHDINALGGAA